MKKKIHKHLRNKEMSDPDWIHKKQQDWFALKAAWQRFEWGSAFIPQACRDAHWIIHCELDRMDEPMKAWKAEKPEWITLRSRKARKK